MSLTSYRAAPPRAGVGRDRGRSRQRRQTDESAAFLRQKRRALVVGDCKEADVVLGRSGDDLLSRVLRHSTIGAEAFNGRVRDGIGFLSPRSDHRTGQRQQQGGRAPPRTFPFRIKTIFQVFLDQPQRSGIADPESPTGRRRRFGGQPRERTFPPAFEANVQIHVQRTGIVRAIKPIERLVPVSSTRRRAYTSGLSTWSSSTALIGSTRFKVGFPLRCLQRLSRPYIATLHCGWRHNSSTRGTSIPVLSY